MPTRTMHDSWHRARARGAVLALAAAACGDAGDGGAGAAMPSRFEPPAGGMQPAGSEGEGAAPGGAGDPQVTPVTVDQFQGVRGYDRAPGMPIGSDAEGDTSGSGESGGPEALPESAGNDDLVIPTFEVEEEAGPPCTQCIELSVHLDSPNQQAEFSFDAGGVDVTRVVWNLIIPKNEDQLFIRTSVNGADGPYRQTLANAFPVVGAPFEYVHEQGEGNVWSGSASQVALKIGSSGGWARNERMRVFVESVVLEGADAASRSFVDGPEGVIATTTAQDPQVTHHP